MLLQESLFQKFLLTMFSIGLMVTLKEDELPMWHLYSALVCWNEK